MLCMYVCVCVPLTYHTRYSTTIYMMMNIVKCCLVTANFIIMDSGQFTIITLKTLLFVIKFPFLNKGK